MVLLLFSIIFDGSVLLYGPSLDEPSIIRCVACIRGRGCERVDDGAATRVGYHLRWAASGRAVGKARAGERGSGERGVSLGKDDVRAHDQVECCARVAGGRERSGRLARVLRAVVELGYGDGAATTAARGAAAEAEMNADEGTGEDDAAWAAGEGDGLGGREGA